MSCLGLSPGLKEVCKSTTCMAWQPSISCIAWYVSVRHSGILEQLMSHEYQNLILRSYMRYQHGVAQPETLQERHIFHCFDYIRVALMCYGDTALEGADPGDEGLHGTEGWGVTHVCIDWDALFDMAVDRARPLDDLGRELGIFP